MDDYIFDGIPKKINTKNISRAEISSYILLYFPVTDEILVQTDSTKTDIIELFKISMFSSINNDAINETITDKTKLNIILQSDYAKWSNDSKFGTFYLKLTACKILDDACVIILYVENKHKFDIKRYIKSKQNDYNSITRLKLINPRKITEYKLDSQQTNEGAFDVIEEIFMPDQYKQKIDAMEQKINEPLQFDHEFITLLYDKLIGTLAGKKYAQRDKLKIRDFCNDVNSLHKIWKTTYEKCLSIDRYSIDISPIYDTYTEIYEKYKPNIVNFIERVNPIYIHSDASFIYDIIYKIYKIFDNLQNASIKDDVIRMIFDNKVKLLDCGFIYNFNTCMTSFRQKLRQKKPFGIREEDYDATLNITVNKMFNDDGEYSKHINKIYKLIVDYLLADVQK